MDTKFQTSFIPKKSMEAGMTRRGASVSIALIVSVIIFVLTLAAAGGVFIYKRALVGRINGMSMRLSEARNSFDPNDIENLARLNKRIEAAKRVINSHTAVSPIFDLLENDALSTVRFEAFSYDLKDSGEGTLVISGRAKTFSSVALQSDIFGQERYIKNPVFSDLNPDQAGNVVFKFNASLDPNLISYKNSVASLGSAQ